MRADQRQYRLQARNDQRKKKGEMSKLYYHAPNNRPPKPIGQGGETLGRKGVISLAER